MMGTFSSSSQWLTVPENKRLTWQIQQVLVSHQEAGYRPKTVWMNRHTFDALMQEVCGPKGFSYSEGMTLRGFSYSEGMTFTLNAELYKNISVRFEEGLPDGEVVVGL